MSDTNRECPFCGSHNIIIDTLNYTSGKPGKYRVQCQGCLAITRWYDTPEQAWEKWNTRSAKGPAQIAGDFVFNDDAFIHESRLYYRNNPGYCYAQKEFRGDMKRIGKALWLEAQKKCTAAAGKAKE
ncbi:hypothetical protein FACS189468_7390 [Spirochaetia bacterium]|nr:hypothetical protein FACS189468_7390 [Spirochaetia bacterium]